MVSLVDCCRVYGSRRRRVCVMVSFGCDEFRTGRRRRLVLQVYVRTSEQFVLKISPGFVNRIVRAPFNSDDIDCQPLEPSTATGLDGVIGWLLSVPWKPSSAGLRHGEFWL
jgi:hypothetical protein